MRERTGPTAPEQACSIPAPLSRAPGPIFTPGQEIVAVAQKLAPSVRCDVGEWAMVVEARDPVDPTGRNAAGRHIDRRIARRAHLRCRHLGRRHVCDLCLPAPRARHARSAATPAADAGHLPEILSLGVDGDPNAARQRLLDCVHEVWRFCRCRSESKTLTYSRTAGIFC